MKPRLHFTLILAVLLLSCQEDTTGPVELDPLLESRALSDVTFTFTGFNQIRIDHVLGGNLRTNSVARVEFGVLVNSTYAVLDSSIATVQSGIAEKKLQMNSTLSFDSSMVWASLRVRYRLESGSVIDVDTTLGLFRYPYLNARFVASMSVFQSLSSPPYTPQDVARLGDILYIHPFADQGLYSYGLQSTQALRAYHYTSGDHIAAESTFVFCDYGGREIHRFNTSLQRVDLVFPNYFATNIFGLATYRNRLYARMPNDYLKQYAFDGTVVDSVHFQKQGAYMAIYDSTIVLLNDALNPPRLDGYNLGTKALVRSWVVPARKCEGIKVYQDTLYYCDFEKRAVFAIPWGDLAAYVH